MNIYTGRNLVIADTHFPYQCNRSIKSTIQAAKRYRPQTIIINGDGIDCHAVSKWQSDPKQRNFKRELDTTREFLVTLRKQFPKADIIYKLANHEERLEKYLWSHAEELTELEELKLPSLLHFKDFGITKVSPIESIELGNLSIIHGDEVGNICSVYPARNLYTATKKSSFANHVHRQSSFFTRDLVGNTYQCYTGGCLCKLNPDYSPYNDWVNGYAMVNLERKNFEVINCVV